MKAIDFVKAMTAASPAKSALEALGMDSDSIEDFVKSYKCTGRKAALKLKSSRGSEDLIELFNRWDPSAVTIGMIQFLETPLDTPRGRQIGVDESQPLLISPGDGEIIVEEEGTGGHRLSEVAKDGNSMLDALVKAVSFLSKRAVGEVAFEDFDAAKIAARDCAIAAGGDKYLRFYYYLLGAEE